MEPLFLFGGLGGAEGAPVAPLRTLYARPENRRYFDMGITAVERAMDHVGSAAWEGHLDDGVPLRGWLESGRSVSRRDLDHAIVTGVCTSLYQLCLLQPRSRALREALDGAGRPASVAGHSLGLYAAAVAALADVGRNGFLEAARQAITAVVLSLLHAHRAAGFRGPGAELGARYARIAEGDDTPSPMACVIGMKVAALGDLLDASALRGIGPSVRLGLVNSPVFQVLTGEPADLVELREAFRDSFERRGVRWFFMKTNAPFHGPLVRSAHSRVTQDREFIGWTIEASQLRVPVFVGSHPGNLQQSGDLLSDLVAKSMVEPVDWPLVMEKAAAGEGIGRVVDFGPGVATQVFTRGCLNRHDRRFSYAHVDV